LGAGWQAMLAELRWRVEKARSVLSELSSEQKRYFRERAELLIQEMDLPPDKASMLLDFAEKLVDCLHRAYPQAETKLQRLLTALENSSVEVELSPRGTKTLHIRPEGEEWHIIAQLRRKTWLYKLPIHRVSAEAEFPDILNLSSEELYYLQAGWRASDECDDKGKPRMATTQAWQVIAWAAVRHGSLWIYLKTLNLNEGRPSIEWHIKAKSWRQQWPTREGKRLAQQAAKQHPLGMLARYLGDGMRHKYSLRYRVGNSEEYVPKELAQQMLNAAYQTGYGKLLNSLDSEKWAALKKLQPRWNPVHAEVAGYTFLLSWNGKNVFAVHRFSLHAHKEAEKCIQTLREQEGVEAKTATSKCGKYIRAWFNAQEIIKLAERYPGWRKAVKELARKHNIQPRGPIIRRLLELAENPPQRALDDKTGKVVSIGKWKGHFSYVSPVRAHRPGEARESVVKDAFREIIEGRDYAIPITLNEQLSDSPFSIEPVLCDSLKDYSAVTIINRFPAMVSARYSQ